MEYGVEEVLASPGLHSHLVVTPLFQHSMIPLIPYLGMTPLANLSV